TVGCAPCPLLVAPALLLLQGHSHSAASDHYQSPTGTYRYPMLRTDGLRQSRESTRSRALGKRGRPVYHPEISRPKEATQTRTPGQQTSASAVSGHHGSSDPLLVPPPSRQHPRATAAQHLRPRP